MMDRVIVLIDMDCFYCQVETRLNPDLKGLPVAVVQYNEWQGGGIIAVNYEARDKGVTRHMRGKEAKEQCPDIILVSVPTLRDKADLTRYREAGREVISVLCSFSDCVERASVDEAYIDLTTAVNKRIVENSLAVSSDNLQNTFVIGYSSEGSNNEDERKSGLQSWLHNIYDNSFQDVAAQKLAVGALIVEEIRKAVFETTGFKCSGGVAHNKILAKLACGLHKPNRQTVVPLSSVPTLYENLPAKKVRSLGGKLGDDLTERLGIKVMADLLKYTENELQKLYDLKTGSWLYNIARGYDYDPVTPRLISKSIGCCKKFPGRTALVTAKDVNHWVTKLAEELLERLNEDQVVNKRRAQLLVVSMVLEVNKKDISSSKSSALTAYNFEKIISIAFKALKKSCTEDQGTKIWSPPIKSLGLSAGKFVNESTNKIMNFFKAGETLNESKKLEDSVLIVKTDLKNNTTENCVDETSKNVKNFFKANEITNKSMKQENYTSIDRVALQNVSNKKTNISNDEKNKLSFFEKMLFKGVSINDGKLNIIPDLNKADSMSENENSRDSNTSEQMLRTETSEDKHDVNTPVKMENICLRKDITPKAKNLLKNNLNNNVGNKKKLAEVSQQKKPILSFFSSAAAKKEWINPKEIFPDINQIDDGLIEMFPLSFRKKILDMKKLSENLGNNVNTLEENELNCSTTYSKIQPNIEKCFENKNDKMEKESQNDVISDDDIFDNSTSKVSTFSNKSNFIICPECGEKIPAIEKNTHLDLHVAIKLDNQLNHKSLGFKSISNSKTIQSTLNKNKRKTNNDSNNKANKKTKSIETFFQKKL